VWPSARSGDNLPCRPWRVAATPASSTRGSGGGLPVDRRDGRAGFLDFFFRNFLEHFPPKVFYIYFKTFCSKLLGLKSFLKFFLIFFVDKLFQGFSVQLF
jgi:hypothetical protein